uniref:Uncharacterized protein n=1 Tax=Avena sativa TaxID=4498 RepID=A0ACD5YCZ4_AVESA
MFAAHAIVDSSCTKLRSVLAIGDETVVGLDPVLLQEMAASLAAIQPLLEDAERRSVKLEEEWTSSDGPREWLPAKERDMQDWLRRVTSNAYKVSDMLDVLQDTRKTTPAAAGKTRIFARRANVPQNMNPMADKLKEMKDELSNLVLESAQFELRPSDPGSILELLVTDASIDDEAKFLGRGAEINRIMAASESYGEGPIIVNIVGDDGSGRTTIAQLVFNHARFKQYARIWICLKSRELRPHEIGRSIISQASGERETSYHSRDDNMDSVKKRLGVLLDNGMKVLLVLDDADLSYADLSNEACIQLKHMLSVGGNKENSRVMVIVITQGMGRPESFTVPPLRLAPLTTPECWTIIKQQSGFTETSDNEELTNIGLVIASRCEGLPLPATVLGGILRYKDKTGWEQAKALDFYPWPGRTPSFLDFAYTSMPLSLRLCFGYFSILPVGNAVAKHDLIHQWMALRLLESSDTLSAKQLGEHCIRILQGMSLLQTTKSSDPTSGKDDTGVIMFTMHPKVHELAESLVRGSDLNNPHYIEELSSYRYALATDFSVWPSEQFIKLSDRLRALRFVGYSSMELSDDAFSSISCLRVLELKEHPMQKLPISICQLRHLGYLNLSGCSRLETLPESFGNLIHLLHIDLSGCSGLVALPESFRKLIDIMHIDLSGCLKLERLPESIVQLTKLVHINLSGCSALVNLPKSLGKLINLVHISLSSCSRLDKLPQSFGKVNLLHLNLSGCHGLTKLPSSIHKLKNVTDITLSGCSRLINLPESFGKLTKLVHIDLSGCSGLVTLPESFGGLTDLRHINLSRCYGLSNLPHSFSQLENLQHLDLSFWSCFGVIRTALVGRTNLQHLNLSHSCCSLAQHQPQLQGLEEVFSKLTSLRYLNLSRFLNPILDSESVEKTQIVLEEKEVEFAGYIKCIRGLSSLEHLDLSQNMFLVDVPACLDKLGKLHTLDLSGCIRLTSIDKKIVEMKPLKTLILRNYRSLKSYQLAVQAVDDGVASYSNLVLLQDADFEELEISCLENAKSVEDAQRIRLAEKRKLKKLKLSWTSVRICQRSVEDNGVLGELVPPPSLQLLELRGYNGELCCLAAWWTNNLLNLAEVTLEDVSMCSQLPPLGVLPNLQQLVLRRMSNITRIDGGDMSFANRPESKQLSRFTIEDMDNLEHFNTRYHRGSADGGELLMFPAMNQLVIRNCSKLCFQPLPPRAYLLTMENCGRVMASACGPTKGGGPNVEADGSPPVTELFVEWCEPELDNWNLLQHLPGLRTLSIVGCRRLTRLPESIRVICSLETLKIEKFSGMTSLSQHLGDLASLRKLKITACHKLASLPDSMRKLTLLESMHLNHCTGIVDLPEWLGQLTSLRKLAFYACRNLSCLPECIRELTNLEYLNIWGCKVLTRWCESEENKSKLAHIRRIYERLASPEPGTQYPQNNDLNTGYGNGASHDSSELYYLQSQRPNGPELPRPPLQVSTASLPQQYQQALSQPVGSAQRDIYLT